jgi:hypothetical protein
MRERGRRDRDCVRAAGSDAAPEGREVDVLLQQCPQRRVVEQRSWHGEEPAAAQQCGEEVQSGAQHVERAGAEHLADAETAPDARELGGGAPKSPASEASTAALMAPAEVPHSTVNGSGDPGGYQPAIALSMPTW